MSEGLKKNQLVKTKKADPQSGYLEEKIVGSSSINITEEDGAVGKRLKVEVGGNIGDAAGVFESTGTLTRQKTAYQTDDFVVGSDNISAEAAVDKMAFNKTTGSFTAGRDNTASGTRSHAEGTSTTASGSASHAEGSGTTASGTNSHAEGQNATASGLRSHAEGSNTTASGSASHAEGSYTLASSSASHAEGVESIARNYAGHAHSGGKITTAGDSQYESVVLKRTQTATGQTPDATFDFNVLTGNGSGVVIPEESIVLFRLEIVTYVHQYQTSTIGGSSSDPGNRAGYVRGYTVAGICWREGAGNVYIAEDGAGTDDGTVTENTFGFGSTKVGEVYESIIEPNIPEGDTGGITLPITMRGIYDKLGGINARVTATLHMTVMGKPANVEGDTFGVCTFGQDTNGDGACDERDL